MLKARIVALVGGGLLLIGLAGPLPPLHGQTLNFAHEAATCTSCHTCEVPTPENPCLRPCVRDARMSMWAEIPLRLPADILILDDLEDLYESVRFDHKVHADMAEMSNGCVTCHHFTPPGTEHAACRSCHATSPACPDIRMPGLKGAYHRQCLTCHREWSGSTACQACHLTKTGRGIPASLDPRPSRDDVGGRAVGSVRPESVYVYGTSHDPNPVVTFHHGQHAETYGQRCADCHSGDACGRCHNDKAEHVGIRHLKTCCLCHQEKNCNFCHDEKERPAFDHATSTGWPLAPFHSSVACTECHGPGRDFRLPSTDCRSCHEHGQAGQFDHRVLSADVDCIGCHAEVGQAGPGMRYSHQPIEQGCTECHDPWASEHAFSLRDAMPTVCFSCHEDKREHFDGATVVHGGATTDASCMACHSPHYSLLPHLMNRTQADLCLGCHNREIHTDEGRSLVNIAALMKAAPNHHGPVRDGECLTCHQPHAGEHFRLLNESYPPGFYEPFEFERYELCFGCHDEELVADESASGSTGFRQGDRNLHWVHVNRDKGRSCSACHNVHASSQPFHIRDRVSLGAGGRMFQINYERMADGGRCAPLCHREQEYDRVTDLFSE